MPSRTLARSEASSSAASSGHTRARSQERHVLREAAEDRLHEMDVRLHETRHEHAAAHVDRLVRFRTDGADLRDAGAADEHVGLQRARPFGERKDEAAPEEDRH